MTTTTTRFVHVWSVHESDRGCGSRGSRMLTKLSILILLHIWIALTFTTEDSYFGEYCQWETFNASCASNEVVLMESAQYGRLRVSRCVQRGFGVLDCKRDVLSLADSKCSGRRRCEILVAEISLKGFHPCPAEFTSYLEAIYKCVPVDTISISNNCLTLNQKTLHASQTGYLASSYFSGPSSSSSSSFYPASSAHDRPTSLSYCGWTMQAEAGHKIHLTLLYFAGTTSSNKSLHTGVYDVSYLCRRIAIVRDKISERDETVCGGKERVKDVFMSDSHVVDIILTVGRHENNQEPHFMFKYEVTGCRTPNFSGTHIVMTSHNTALVICNVTSEKWPLTCVDSSWTGIVGDCEEISEENGETASMWSTLTNEWKTPRGLTLVIGLGILLGIAVGMMMLAIAICLIRQKPHCLHAVDLSSDMEMVEDGNPSVAAATLERMNGARWICAEHGLVGDKDQCVAGTAMWQLQNQFRLSSTQGHQTTTCPSGGQRVDDRQQTMNSGYQTIYVDRRTISPPGAGRQSNDDRSQLTSLCDSRLIAGHMYDCPDI